MILLTWTIYCHHQKVLHNMLWMAFTIRENLSLILSELEWVGTSYDINIENCFAAPMPMKIISNGNIFYSSQKIYTIYYTVEEIHIKNIEYLFWMQITIKIVYSNYGNSLDMNILGLMDLKAHPRKKPLYRIRNKNMMFLIVWTITYLRLKGQRQLGVHMHIMVFLCISSNVGLCVQSWGIEHQGDNMHYGSYPTLEECIDH